MDITPGQVLPGFYDSFNRRFSIDNPIILIILSVIIILYYIVFNYLGCRRNRDARRTCQRKYWHKDN